MANLSLFDAIVLVAYMFGVVALGLWIGRGSQDAKRYMLGGKNLPWWAILGSIVATETSTVTFLSIPGISFAEQGDMRFLQLAFGYIVGRIVITIWLLPNYFRGQIFTVYELLQARLGTVTRKTASLIFLVTRNLGDGLRLFLTALVLEVTLEWSLPACVVVIGIATIIFTYFGGMQSVIWNDCIQLVVYMAGGILALALIAQNVDGGFAAVWEFGSSTDRFRIFDWAFFDESGPRFDETFTFWAGLIGGGFLTLGTHGTDQMLVQRLLAAKSQGDAGKALVTSGFVVLFQFALFLVVGVALACFYASNPPAEPFTSGDQVLSRYIVTEMPVGVGIVGVLLAAIFSAAMSTLSSSLNSSATTVVADWIATDLDSQEQSDKSVRATRLLTIVFGVLQMGIAIWAASFDESVVSNALAIAGFASGLLLGLFSLGLFLKNADQRAAVIGLSVGLLVLLVVKFVLPNLPDGSSLQYALAWPWFPVVGSLSTFLAGFLACQILKNETRGDDRAFG